MNLRDMVDGIHTEIYGGGPGSGPQGGPGSKGGDVSPNWKKTVAKAGNRTHTESQLKQHGYLPTVSPEEGNTRYGHRNGHTVSVNDKGWKMHDNRGRPLAIGLHSQHSEERPAHLMKNLQHYHK